MIKTLTIIFFIGSFAFGYGFPEYYYEIKESKKQKKEFVRILKPLLEKANEAVLYEKTALENFFLSAINRGFRNFQKDELAFMVSLAKKYRVKKLFNKEEFLKRVNVVPISLGLTQGALESGWGKSRFVREANNIFGHWTWGEVGLVPEQRDEGKTHKIRIFHSLQASVNAYVLNLNRNYAYRDFRKLRYEYMKKHKKFNGLIAATTMVNYSELDNEYIDILQDMMQKNDFLIYD
jgi:Bax protein